MNWWNCTTNNNVTNNLNGLRSINFKPLKILSFYALQHMLVLKYIVSDFWCTETGICKEYINPEVQRSYWILTKVLFSFLVYIC